MSDCVFGARSGRRDRKWARLERSQHTCILVIGDLRKATKFHEFPAAGGCWRAFGVVGKSCCEAYGKKKEGEEVLE